MSVSQMSPSAERRLIRKASAGDGQAVEALIRAHQTALYAFMLRMSGRPEIAEDIVQEAFVRVLRNLDRFDTRFRFSTWLFTIAKRLYVNASQKLTPTFDSESLGRFAGTMDSPGRASVQIEIMDNVRGLLQTALHGLSTQQREIILLFHQQNWPIADIASHLSIPQGTVKSHLHRARKRMRQIILEDQTMSRQVQEVWA